jgi:hypothetical protein
VARGPAAWGSRGRGAAGRRWTARAHAPQPGAGPPATRCAARLAPFHNPLAPRLPLPAPPPPTSLPPRAGAECTSGGAKSTFPKSFWSVGATKLAARPGKALVKGTTSSAFTVKLPGGAKMKWDADTKLCINLMGAPPLGTRGRGARVRAEASGLPVKPCATPAAALCDFPRPPLPPQPSTLSNPTPASAAPRSRRRQPLPHY